ncbi:hypothetical protein [Streptomyces sp. NPDC048196]|uniref:hypothetical protein n=1 Tax=Streptomyces sp. NPDC048196 TaxID=3154712 RepID=UPI0033F60F90
MNDECPDTGELRDAVRELAEALETMLNLLKADAVPRTPEAQRLIRQALPTLESDDLLANPPPAGELLAQAIALNKMTTAAREQILDDEVAASPVPDHPPF